MPTFQVLIGCTIQVCLGKRKMERVVIVQYV